MEKESFLQKLNEQKISYLFIALPAVLFFIFQLAPVIISFFWSFTRYDVVHSPKFVGLANYREILFNDPLFWKAMANTVIYVLGVVPIGICLSLLLAVAIDQKIKFKNFFKSIFFLPTVTAIVAVSVIWKWLDNEAGFPAGRLAGKPYLDASFYYDNVHMGGAWL
jgi:multiple sugar transport system permease protein